MKPCAKLFQLARRHWDGGAVIDETQLSRLDRRYLSLSCIDKQIIHFILLLNEDMYWLTRQMASGERMSPQVDTIARTLHKQQAVLETSRRKSGGSPPTGV